MIRPVDQLRGLTEEGKNDVQSTSDDAASTRETSGWLSQLGLIGLEELELPLLCGLVTSDPILLIGDHGTAKTALAECLAKTMDLKFHAYDASKALFEDIVGFPNPDQLGQGRLEYVPTKVSIWDREFVLVDEISRANPQTQSKWLEVIRSRRLMGEPLDQLKYIIGAMNPPGSYEGAMPLDSALAGRFSFVLKVPTAAEMESEDRRSVMRSISGDDAPGLRDAFSVNVEPAASPDLPGLIRTARNRLPEVRDLFDQPITRYLEVVVDEVYSARSDQAPFLDGRRLGMMRRNLLSAIALDPENNQEPEVFESIVRASLPHPAVGDEVPEHLYQMAFLEARRVIWNSKSGRGSPETIDLQGLLRETLEYTTTEEALPALAQLGRYLIEVTRGAKNIKHGAEVLRRILPWAMRSSWLESRELSRVQELIKVQQVSQESLPALASLLLTWWYDESESNRRSRKKLEEVLEQKDKLAEIISSLLGVDQS